MTPTTATATTAPERVLKVYQVAAHLGCDEGSVYRLIKGNELRAIRVGRLIRVPVSALNDYIAGRPVTH